MGVVNMKRLIITVAITLLVAFGGYVYLTKPCLAVYCFSGLCSSGMQCGRGCVCVKAGGETFGECYSVD